MLVAGRAPGPRLVSDAAAPAPVPKPWGHELIWALTDRYCGKVIVIEAGKPPVAPVPRRARTRSIYRHARPAPAATSRTTTGIVRSTSSGPGEIAHVPDRPDPPLRGARADVELIEVSTPELDDVVRLEDDFGREGTSRPVTAVGARRRRIRVRSDRDSGGDLGPPAV